MIKKLSVLSAAVLLSACSVWNYNPKLEKSRAYKLNQMNVDQITAMNDEELCQSLGILANNQYSSKVVPVIWMREAQKRDLVYCAETKPTTRVNVFNS